MSGEKLEMYFSSPTPLNSTLGLFTSYYSKSYVQTGTERDPCPKCDKKNFKCGSLIQNIIAFL
jgi:hypothetical protein